MNRLLRFLSVVLMCFYVCQAWAQGTSSSNISSLQRFESIQSLGINSDIEIRDVFIGESILSEVTRLISQGGKVHYIAGGNRSERVKVSFYQPYQQTQLEQLLLLNFDKDHGFITNINLTYSLKSRYSKIAPVYQKVVDQAIKKYGEPMSFSEISAIVDSTQTEVRLAEFINKFEANPLVEDKISAYFEQKLVTSRTHFVDDGNGNAILKFGFRQCYFWSKRKFAEILSLCSFQPNSGNMKGQGVTLKLVNFLVQTEIASFSSAVGKEIEIEF